MKIITLLFTLITLPIFGQAGRAPSFYCNQEADRAEAYIDQINDGSERGDRAIMDILSAASTTVRNAISQCNGDERFDVTRAIVITVVATVMCVAQPGDESGALLQQAVNYMAAKAKEHPRRAQNFRNLSNILRGKRAACIRMPGIPYPNR